MLSQRSAFDTLVPPNFNTIHGAVWILGGAAEGLDMIDVNAGDGRERSLSLCSAKKQVEPCGGTRYSAAEK
jgi:hypothetical protein